jgi:hypothetical protein
MMSTPDGVRIEDRDRGGRVPSGLLPRRFTQDLQGFCPASIKTPASETPIYICNYLLAKNSLACF